LYEAWCDAGTTDSREQFERGSYSLPPHYGMPALTELRKLNCTDPGRGPWKVVPDTPNRSIVIQHRGNRYIHRVYYGTRTGRSQADAEMQATALCAVLNAVKAKRP